MPFPGLYCSGFIPRRCKLPGDFFIPRCSYIKNTLRTKNFSLHFRVCTLVKILLRYKVFSLCQRKKRPLLGRENLDAVFDKGQKNNPTEGEVIWLPVDTENCGEKKLPGQAPLNHISTDV